MRAGSDNGESVRNSLSRDQLKLEISSKISSLAVEQSVLELTISFLLIPKNFCFELQKDALSSVTYDSQKTFNDFMAGYGDMMDSWIKRPLLRGERVTLMDDCQQRLLKLMTENIERRQEMLRVQILDLVKGLDESAEKTNNLNEQTDGIISRVKEIDAEERDAKQRESKAEVSSTDLLIRSANTLKEELQRVSTEISTEQSELETFLDKSVNDIKEKFDKFKLGLQDTLRKTMLPIQLLSLNDLREVLESRFLDLKDHQSLNDLRKILKSRLLNLKDHQSSSSLQAPFFSQSGRDSFSARSPDEKQNNIDIHQMGDSREGFVKELWKIVQTSDSDENTKSLIIKFLADTCCLTIIGNEQEQLTDIESTLIQASLLEVEVAAPSCMP